jgi:hypothetical protein
MPARVAIERVDATGGEDRTQAGDSLASEIPVRGFSANQAAMRRPG